MSLTVVPPVLDAHATRVAMVFAPKRGVFDDQLKHFFSWFDGVIQQGAKGSPFAKNIVLDHVAAISPPLANQVCDMHSSLARRNWNPVALHIDYTVKRVLETIMQIFPGSENQLVVDSLVSLVEYACYEEDPPYNANSRINTAEMLFEKLDPEIVAYVKAHRSNIPTGTP